MTGRVLTLRRDDSCAVCAAPLKAQTRAAWDGESRTVTCLPCLSARPARDPTEIPDAEPGAAGRELTRVADAAALVDELQRLALEFEGLEFRSAQLRLPGCQPCVEPVEGRAPSA